MIRKKNMEHSTNYIKLEYYHFLFMIQKSKKSCPCKRHLVHTCCKTGTPLPRTKGENLPVADRAIRNPQDNNSVIAFKGAFREFLWQHIVPIGIKNIKNCKQLMTLMNETFAAGQRQRNTLLKVNVQFIMKYSESLPPFLQQFSSKAHLAVILILFWRMSQLEKPSVIKSRTSKFFSKHGAQDGNSNNLNHPRLFGVPFWQFPSTNKWVPNPIFTRNRLGHGKPTVIIYLFIYLQ